MTEFRVPWLYLFEVRIRLERQGMTVKKAEEQIILSMRSGEIGKIRIPGRTTPLRFPIKPVGGIMPPILNFEDSSILLDVPSGSNFSQEWFTIQLPFEGVDRLWPDPAGTSPPPPPSAPPANDNPSGAVRTIANEKAEKDCIAWLQRYVDEGGERLTKAAAFSLAKEQPWGDKVSETGFDARVWPAAVPADWRTGGRPKKPPG